MSGLGKLVILTGGNGAGKGTTGPLTAASLSQETGDNWHYLCGPKINGYTTRVREITLDSDPTLRPSDNLADALLWFSQHAETSKVVNALRENGTNVVLDRGPETTLVYNVYGRSLELEYPWVESIYQSLLTKFNPNLGIILDVTAKEALRRSSRQGETDHYQQQQTELHEQRRQIFLKLAQDPLWIVVDAMPPVEVVLESILERIRSLNTRPVQN